MSRHKRANREEVDRSTFNRDSSEILKEINRKFDRLLALTACQGKPTNTQVQILTRAGLTAKEIGDLLGMSADAVRHRRSRMRKE